MTLFDFGVTEEGAFDHVMELLDGVDTDTFIVPSGPIPAERVVHILRHMCHSLSEAESSGLVHRDIKPANIFLCRYGEDYDFVKVLDFGIAKVAHEESSKSNTAMPMPNVVPWHSCVDCAGAGIGRQLRWTTRADIYSTGCVAYWLLTGLPVFMADTPMKLLLAHAHAPPEPPSVQELICRFPQSWMRWSFPALPSIVNVRPSRPGTSSSDSKRRASGDLDRRTRS